LTDGLTMTEKAVIQKPRIVLGHLGRKKNIATITHNNDKEIIIVAHNDEGADYAQGLWKSLIEKNGIEY
jgi:hypothetical protein